MTEALTIYTSAGTINLMSASSQTGTGYFSDFTPSIGEGREPDSITTDTFPMYVGGTSRADLATKLNALQTAFEGARIWQDTGAGLRTFVNWQPEGYAAGRRSEVVSGGYSLASGWKNQFSNTAGHRALIDVSITRRNWWEGAEAQISLTNDNGTDNTSGLPIYHNNSAIGTAPTKQVNYVDITPEKVLGEVPCNVRIELTYVSGTIRAPIFVQSSNNQSYGTTSAFWNENPSGYWTAIASPTSTGGTAYYQYFDAGLGSNAIMTGFSAYTDNFKIPGNYRGFLALAPLSSGQSMKIWNSFSDHGEPAKPFYYDTDLSSRIVEMGITKFPVNASYLPTDILSATLDIQFQAVTAGTVYYDWASFVRCDSYICYKFLSSGIGGSTVFFDDGLDNLQSYLYSTATSKILSWLNFRGKRITLAPNKYNRIHLFPYQTTYIGGQSTIKIYYRPRYLCL